MQQCKIVDEVYVTRLKSYFKSTLLGYGVHDVQGFLLSRCNGRDGGWTRVEIVAFEGETREAEDHSVIVVEKDRALIEVRPAGVSSAPKYGLESLSTYNANGQSGEARVEITSGLVHASSL